MARFTMMNQSFLGLASSRFEYIPEFNEFLDLFPHRGSFLWAQHPQPGQRPAWQTETRHLLTDRLIQEGNFLYGVRFGAQTYYLMIDIDRKSDYHPSRDPFAIDRILSFLEPLGLFRYVAITSSYSGGLHLYFPFVQSQPSWAIARAASVLLEKGGFKPHRGHLETFPNNRLSFGADYNGHRLPLQTGSYLVDRDWQPIYTSPSDFVNCWNWAQNANPVHLDQIEEIIKAQRRGQYKRIRGRAAKFLNDLNAEITPGWTGYGQTNHLLGKIAQRAYIFHHALHGVQPLTGENLAAEICEVAVSLPGFEQYCRHRRELPSLCRYWARCVEMSNYYPYGGQASLDEPQPTPIDHNEKKALEARERIRLAVKQLEASGEMPQSIRLRLLAIRKIAKCSSDTLYKNKDLWHVENRLKAAPDGLIRTVDTQNTDPRSLEAAPDGLIRTVGTNKLKPVSVPLPPAGDTDGNSVPDQGEHEGGEAADESPPLEGVNLLRSILKRIEAENKQKRLQRLSNDPGIPPDENWFQPLLGGLGDE